MSNDMILKDVRQYLIDEEVASSGSIFIGNMDNSGIILTTGGNESQDMYQGLRYETIDFWVRNASYEAGYQQARDIIDLLHRLSNWETTNYHVFFSHALGGVEDLDRDGEGKKIFKVSIRFIFRNLTDIS